MNRLRQLLAEWADLAPEEGKVFAGRFEYRAGDSTYGLVADGKDSVVTRATLFYGIASRIEARKWTWDVLQRDAAGAPYAASVQAQADRLGVRRHWHEEGQRVEEALLAAYVAALTGTRKAVA